MASISSVITMGFGAPGSAALVITDGYGLGAAVVADTLRGRRRRRWRPSVLATQAPTAAAVREEKKLLDEMLPIAEVEDLIGEQKVLRGAVEMAAGRQAKAINAMLGQLERRIAEVIEDEEVVSLLIQ